MALYKSVYYYYYFLTPVLNSQGMKKITLCNTKKYKNQAGMNLTPPAPSQNSHAVSIIVIENCDKWVKTDWLLRS